MLKKVSYSFFLFCLFFFWLWCIAALYFMFLPAEKLPIITSALFAFNIPLLFFLLPNRKQAALIVFGLCLLVFLYWNQLVEPTHDRNWMPSVAKLPYAEIEGNDIKFFNVRNFEYKTEHDFEIQYFNKRYDLDTLQSVDYILSYWDGNKAIAHVILSFGFSTGEHLAVSVETRLDQQDQQGGLAGLFKQYELLYILADERDLLRLRTNFRKEQVFLYPTTVNKKGVRKMFDIVIASVNDLQQHPEFYNTITDNCFSNLASKFRSINQHKVEFDYRRFAIGYSDALLYEQGKIDTDLSFAKAKQKFHINQYVNENDSGIDYSTRIRP